MSIGNEVVPSFSSSRRSSSFIISSTVELGGIGDITAAGLGGDVTAAVLGMESLKTDSTPDERRLSRILPPMDNERFINTISWFWYRSGIR